MLARQRDEALSELDFNELKDTINWDVVFGNLDKVAKKELQKVKRQIVSFRNSPEFKKSATPEQMQVIEEAIGKIEQRGHRERRSVRQSDRIHTGILRSG